MMIRNMIFLLSVFWVSLAQAHPHVSVTAKTMIIADSTGNITALRHEWRFDEAFSAFSTTGLDSNKDGVYSREELAPLAQVNVESLHEYGFFTQLKQGKISAEFAQPHDYFLSYDGKFLTLHFTLPIKGRPFILNASSLEVYDPSYFVSFEFAPQEPVRITGVTGCRVALEAPKAAVVQKLSQLGEAFFQSLEASKSAEWAHRAYFTCSP